MARPYLSPPRHRLTGRGKLRLSPPATGAPSDCSPVCLWGDVSLCYVSPLPPLPTQPLERQVLLVQPVLQTGNLGRKGLWPWFLPEVHGGHTQAYSSGLGRSHER